MKILALALACALASLTLGGAAANPAVGIVSFTVDNITMDFYKKRFPSFRSSGIVGTLYAQTEPVGKFPWNMGWNEIKDMHLAGWEIGAHSYSHEVHLSKASDQVLDLELGAPAAMIYRKIGVYPETFATPFGDYDDRVLGQVRHYYDAHLKAWGNEGLNPIVKLDRYQINRVEFSHEWSAEEACGRIEQAGAKGQWLVLMIHGITDGEVGEYNISQNVLESVLSCTVQLRDAGKLRVATAADALKSISNNK